MKKRYLINLLTPIAALMLIGWGYSGHEKINREASLSYHQEMSQFYNWTEFLAAHASDADERKSWDPDEGPKHYIDIDNYQQFINTGTIPQTLDSVIAIYGYGFVYNQGILPWATLMTYDSLRACMSRHDWNKAKYFAADLGHYVADGHMPLHITRNYNGQYSGNTGIHSRYESTMINSYVSQISYEGYNLSIIENVNQYVFDYLYYNYTFVDSVLMADDFARSIAGNTNSSAYRQILWEKSKDFTIALFANASYVFANLIYNAWVSAGSPSMTATSEEITGNQLQPVLKQNIPNPFKENTTIHYSLPDNMVVQLLIRNSEGMIVDTLVNGFKTTGDYSVEWKGSENPAGVYYLVFHAGSIIEVKKMIMLER